MKIKHQIKERTDNRIIVETEFSTTFVSELPDPDPAGTAEDAYAFILDNINDVFTNILQQQIAKTSGN